MQVSSCRIKQEDVVDYKNDDEHRVCSTTSTSWLTVEPLGGSPKQCLINLIGVIGNERKKVHKIRRQWLIRTRVPFDSAISWTFKRVIGLLQVYNFFYSIGISILFSGFICILL